MPEGLRIGDLAARTGHSVHTIRWYEAQGLIPGVIRNGAGQRIYHPRHVDWLGFMARLRLTGMSIAQMRQYTALARQGRATLRERRELLAAHRARVRDMIADWMEAEKLLDSKIDYYGEWLSAGKRPEAPRGWTGAAPARRKPARR